MVASNSKAVLTMVAYHVASKPDSKLFHGRLFFLGGSTKLENPAPGVEQGDLSGVAAKRLNPLLRPYAFPPLELALEPNWDAKLEGLAEKSILEPITMISGVPSWLLVLFQKLLRRTGKTHLREIWPMLEMIIHGGVKFDPYQSAFAELCGPGVRLQESYPCSEGFIAFGDPSSGLLRLVFDHGVFYEFVPTDELDSSNPIRHWLGNVKTGIEYAIVVSTCAGMWGHIIGDTVRFESLDPPLITFTGRTKYTLSAFGEHLISEEIESAMTEACRATGSSILEWHAGPIFAGSLGHHLYILEFVKPPSDLARFRSLLDADLRARNADYDAHRDDSVGLPLPAIVEAKPGSFEAWMRKRGKLGGQNKVPRMDNSGVLTREILEFLKDNDLASTDLSAG